MNLEQSISLEALHIPPKKVVTPKKRSAVQVARRVFQLAANGGFPYKYQTPESWSKKWLSSPEFTLMEIDIHAAASLNINAVASPHPPKNPNRVNHYVHCSVDALDPIVVDLNKRQVGKSYLGYIPEVIVLDGKHRKMAQLKNGRTKILAWVGAKAAKRLEQYKKVARVVDAASEDLFLPPVEPTKIAAAYEMYASISPSVRMAPGMKRQDAGEGGARGTVQGGGPGGTSLGNGSGNLLTMKTSDIKSELKELTASRDANKLPRIKALTKELKSRMAACGSRSSGSLEEASASDEKVPRDASDAGPHVEASDRRIWNPNKPQRNAPGTKGWSSEVTGYNPAAVAPGTGVGPRLKPNTGASRSELSRSFHAKSDASCGCGGKCKDCKEVKAKGMKSGKLIKKIYTKAPPGREKQVLKLKEKYGDDSSTPFKIAWSQYHKDMAAGGPGSGRHKEALRNVNRQLKGIDPQDLHQSERNILDHLSRYRAGKISPVEARNRIANELKGIDYSDLSTAERNIRNIVGEPNNK